MPSWKDRSTVEGGSWKDRSKVESPVEPQKTAVENAIGSVIEAPSVGERIPIIGPLAAKAGTALGALSYAPFSEKTFGELYNEAVAEDEKNKAEYAKKYPVANVAQDLAAGVALPGPGSGSAIIKGATSTIPKAINVAGEIGRKAAINYGAAEADAFLRGAPEGSGVGAAGATVAAEMLPRVAKPVAKAVRKYGFGVTDKLAESYAKRAPFINKESEQLLKQDIDGVISGLKSSAAQAKDAYKAAETSGRTAQQIETMRLAQTQPGIEKGAELVDAAKSLRAKISDRSSAAFDALQESGETIDVAPIAQKIKGLMGDLKIGNMVPPPNTAAGQSYEKLDTYRKFLQDVAKDGGGIQPVELKKFVQMVDNEIESAFESAKGLGYISKGDKNLIKMRGQLNEYLREIPEYSDIMGPLAEDTRLLKAVSDSFETEGEALKFLKGAAKPENRESRQLISSLESKTGGKFLDSVDQYEKAQALLKDPVKLQQHLDSLPSSQRAKELLALSEIAKKKAADVTGGVTEKGTQSLIRRVASEARPDIQGRKVLENLGKEGGQDFIQRAEDLAAQRALNQGFTRGSRNVNLGAASFGGAAGLLSQKLVPQGGALGAVAGAMADIVGPQTYKKIIDLSGTPQFQRFAKVLEEAASRGPLAAAVAHNNLLKSDQDYRRMIESQP